MSWKIAKLLVEDYAKLYDISGDMKALLTVLLVKEVITEKDIECIISYGGHKALKGFR